jgi:manganese/zinc/iron transport system permease protein
MSELINLFSILDDPNTRYVITGTLLLGISAGVLGCFAILRRRALVGDAVAHAVLPGVCLAFIVVGDKDPFALMTGSLIFGWISMIVMDSIVRNTKLSTDASIGMVLSVFFGLGVVLLTYIQGTGNPNQSGLDAFLFGNAASLLPDDVMVFGSLSLIILFVVAITYKEMKLVSFDPGYAKAIGYPVKRLEFMIATLMVMTITVGLQAVGVVLMASMLIIPAAAGRYWTESLGVMIIIAGLTGAVSGVGGTLISDLAPAMPTGPWIVLTALAIFVISFLFAPRRGEVIKKIRSMRNRVRIQDENVLKTIYLLEEKDGSTGKVRSMREILKRRRMNIRRTRSSLMRLDSDDLIEHVPGNPSGYLLTETGRIRAMRLVRVHRLWELYLTNHVQIAGDHVHDDAESMEHLITPEIEAELTDVLGKPVTDPHDRNIPYDAAPAQDSVIRRSGNGGFTVGEKTESEKQPLKSRYRGSETGERNNDIDS